MKTKPVFVQHVQIFFKKPEAYEAVRRLADQANLPISTWCRLQILKNIEALTRKRKVTA